MKCEEIKSGAYKITIDGESYIVTDIIGSAFKALIEINEDWKNAFSDTIKPCDLQVVADIGFPKTALRISKKLSQHTVKGEE